MVLLSAALGQAGEKKLMHCFAWTPIKEATPADWEAFYKASDALPKKIKGITKVWYGKLVAPFNWTMTRMNDENRKKLNAGQPAVGEVSRAVREYGMCMEMTDANALKEYDAHPYHKIWTDAYAKVRVEGTTTFDIMGR